MSQQFQQQQPYQPAPVPPKKKHRGRTALIVIGSVIGGLFVIAALAPSEPAKEAVTNSPAAVKTVDNGPTPEPVVTPTNKPTVAKTTLPPVKPTPPKPTQKPMTMSQEQAVGTAEDYLNGQSFSRKGLIEQLVYEGFSVKDATFGVDYLKVNWSAQAVEVAKGYLNGQHFSRSGLIEQLEYEGFTNKQAVYGVTKAGL